MGYLLTMLQKLLDGYPNNLNEHTKKVNKLIWSFGLNLGKAEEQFYKKMDRFIMEIKLAPLKMQQHLVFILDEIQAAILIKKLRYLDADYD